MSLHREVFTNLVETQGWTRGAELGVDKGILFGMLLKRCPDLNLIGVDTFPDRDRSRKAFDMSVNEGRRAHLFVMTTAEAAEHVSDGSQDFVFIDADHSYPAVKDDIERWRPKVRQGGWLGGHDYNRKFPGVIAAVQGIFGLKVRQWPGSIWGVWC